MGGRKSKEEGKDTQAYWLTIHASLVLLMALRSRYYTVFQKEELKGMPFPLYSILKPTSIFKQRYAMASLQTSGIPEFGIIPKIWNSQLFFLDTWKCPHVSKKYMLFENILKYPQEVTVWKLDVHPLESFLFSPLICDVIQVRLPSLLNQNLKSKLRNSWGLNSEDINTFQRRLPRRASLWTQPLSEHEWTWGVALPLLERLRRDAILR